MKQILYKCTKSLKTIRYEIDEFGGKYAVVEYTRFDESRPFRSYILHGQ
jgi:hypothetical protein